MQVWLMSKELWMLVNGDEPSPDGTDKDLKLKWQKRAEKAVTRHVEESVQKRTAKLREAVTRYQTARVRSMQLRY